MKTKLIKPTWLAAMLLLLSSVQLTASAYDFMVDGIAYNRNSDGTSVSVTSTGTSPNYKDLEHINIPAQVTYDGKTYQVTAIGYYGLCGAVDVKSVTLPEGLISIGECGLNSLSSITELTLPSTLKSVSGWAFEHIDNAEHITCLAVETPTINGFIPNVRITFEKKPAITTYTVNGVSFNMVDVEGGTFTMGATPEQGLDFDYDEELPAHQVTLSGFSIGQTEVTQELWQAVMGSNPSYHTGNLQYPVERVSWGMCQEFIDRLNLLTGKKFRLPTEAEWEFAARGGNKSQGYKYAGSNNADDVAWYRYNSGHESHPVGMKLPNELGLYDMTGNVWERLADWFGPYSSEPQFNPTGPETGLKRCTRGSGFGITYDMEGDLYGPHPVCERGADYESEQHHDMGLRIVLETENAGDVNGDGKVNVMDVTALIYVIMNDGSNPRADVNGDGDINVMDITALIDIIMNS
jgi:formylglycine-generating enzyme required for sulfatase activity